MSAKSLRNLVPPFTVLLIGLIVFLYALNQYAGNSAIGSLVATIAGLVLSVTGGYGVTRYFLNLNVQRGNQNFQATSNKFEKSNVIQSTGTVHIHQESAGTRSQKSRESEHHFGKRVREKFSRKEEIDFESWIHYELRIAERDKVVVEMKASKAFDIYIVTPSSFNSFKNDYNFNPLWAAENRRSCTFSYECQYSGLIYLVISSQNEEFRISVDLKVVGPS